MAERGPRHGRAGDLGVLTPTPMQQALERAGIKEQHGWSLPALQAAGDFREFDGGVCRANRRQVPHLAFSKTSSTGF